MGNKDILIIEYDYNNSDLSNAQSSNHGASATPPRPRLSFEKMSQTEL